MDKRIKRHHFELPKISDLAGFGSYFNLNGKVALVTGGSCGLGLHTATAFLKAGAKTVIITARKYEGPLGIRQAVEKLNQLPGIQGKAIGIAANVARVDEIERLVSEVQKLEPKLDILVANAGATWGGPFETTPDSRTQKVLDLNVRGTFNLARLFTPMLESSGTKSCPSRIILVSSIAGTHVPHVGEHGTIVYSISKAAAHHLTKNLAVELGPKNIITNSISPGFFPSKLANGLIEILGGEDELKRANPCGRLGDPDDIGVVMVFLAGPGASYINGVDIPIDGGNRLIQGTLSKL
ncbi:NAD(P)-binding protein [Penicillium malachiteum]|nr:NAD(P)-binding protein [Penicillium malachiteum]